MNAFSRLAPFIREYIYEKKWTALRDIQEEAAAAILDGTGHVLIAAGTAAGKTEAAFFPVISRIHDARRGALSPPLSVLYIGPLKALINDQFERLGELLSRAELPLWRWHGDVAESRKKKFLENPSGILQITPESLEALLLRRPEKIRSLFRDLSFVIIDEVHAFMGSDRGSQLLCQIGRIAAMAGCDARRIGLSASLGSYGEALAWLGRGSSGKTVLVREREEKKRFRIAVDCFGYAEAGHSGPSETEEAAYYRELYRRCTAGGAGKRIIFTNSRLEAEETIARLRKEAARRHEEDIFHVHHGSISRLLRTEAEKELREREGPMVTAATATLELGIDIGRLDRIIQIGAPASAAGFVQRLGRSGRRGGIPEIYFSSLAETGDSKSIPWPLIRTIAVIRLYLEEQWMEDSPERPLPFSLLCHQTLSVLASLRELEREELTEQVLSLAPFAAIDREDFQTLLDTLLEGDYIEEEGKRLIIGLEGESLINRHSFYTVFPDEEAYRIIHENRELGTVNYLPLPGGTLVLAGRYWQVRELDRKLKRAFVVPAQRGGERLWRGGGGEIHTRIVQKMREVLGEDKDYPCLSDRARKALAEGRRRGRFLLEQCLVPETREGAERDATPDGNFRFVPWLGSRGLRTLTALLQNREVRRELRINSLYRENEYMLTINSELPLGRFSALLKEIRRRLDESERLLDADRIPPVDKYDYLLPPRLLLKQYAANMLNPGEVKKLLEDL
jgi:ATP-dependent Lhr-like helicase